MKEFNTYPLFLPKYCVLPIEQAAQAIVQKAVANQSFGVTALAVHGLIESLRNRELGNKINNIDMILPDGQPVVWALNRLHNLSVSFKVPGPDLTAEVLRLANSNKLRVYLYGSTADTLDRFSAHIAAKYPGISICGMHEDRFRSATEQEDISDIQKINQSGAQIVLVGRGCPRQELWVADHLGKINAPMLAVGAAFDYHAGNLKRAPLWMQKSGLEWLYRLGQEPGRLFKRYLTTNSLFIWLCIKHGVISRQAT